MSLAQAVHPEGYGLKEFSINHKKLRQIQFYVDTVNIRQKAPLFIEINGSGGLPLCLYLKGNRLKKALTNPVTKTRRTIG